MFKKIYRKGGFVYIDTNENHNIGEVDKNYFIIKEIDVKNGEIKKKDAIKSYYISMGFNYTL
jgi:hypothetical protein